MILDIKMGENFCRKAHFVAGGHMTETPTILTYASIVSRYSVSIALNIADINGIDILSCKIQNTYLTAECREKIWTQADPEFGSDAGTIMIVRMTLYGPKSSIAAFCAHLAETLNEIGFLSTKGEPGGWYQTTVKPSSFDYYKYILCYVDDILYISHDPGISVRRMQAVFKFKGDKMEQPEIYLEDQVRKMIIDGEEGWYISA